MKCALISIKPKYSQAIFLGQKDTELRRYFPNPEVTTAAVYECRPTAAVVGIIEFSSRFESIDHMWFMTQNAGVYRHGLNYDEFNRYFQGLTHGWVLHITGFKKFINPINIRELGISTPPQNYRYISDSTFERLMSLEGEHKRSADVAAVLKRW